MHRPFRVVRATTALLGWLLVFVVGATSLWAGDKGTVTGMVAGPSRVPIPGAKVTLAAADGSLQSATADPRGHYSFSSVEPGSYTLVAEAAGYQAAKRVEVRVMGGTSTTVDLLLMTAGPPGPTPSSSNPHLSFHDDTQLKASAVHSTIDAAGYSSQARSPRRLLSEGPSLASKAPGARSGEAENASGAPDLQKLQQAAQAGPSEENLFELGNELLLEEKIEPAIEVFKKGVALDPHSARMSIGLGIGLYSRGSYDAAIEALCHASDLDPSDPRAYVFLGMIYNGAASQAEEVGKRMKRFMETSPDNALAYYYGALTIWKGLPGGVPAAEEEQVEGLLRKAIALDPLLANAHLQLGILLHGQHHEEQAILEFQAAVRLNPDNPDAHYHLAQAYLRTGDEARGEAELQRYEDLRKRQADETEKRRREIQRAVGQKSESLKTNP